MNNKWEMYLRSIIHGLIFLVGITGNIFIMFFFAFKMKRAPNFRWYIIHLAIADCTYAFVSPLHAIYLTFSKKWKLGITLCKLSYLGPITVNVSVFIMCLMAFERYRAICHPLRERYTKRVINGSVFVVWLFCIVLKIPVLYRLDVDNDGICGIVTDSKLEYFLISCSFILFESILPLSVLFIFFLCITRAIKKHEIFMDQNDSNFHAMYSSQNSDNMENVTADIQPCLDVFPIVGGESSSTGHVHVTNANIPIEETLFSSIPPADNSGRDRGASEVYTRETPILTLSVFNFEEDNDIAYERKPKNSSGASSLIDSTDNEEQQILKYFSFTRINQYNNLSNHDKRRLHLKHSLSLAENVDTMECVKSKVKGGQDVYCKNVNENYTPSRQTSAPQNVTLLHNHLGDDLRSSISQLQRSASNLKEFLKTASFESSLNRFGVRDKRDQATISVLFLAVSLFSLTSLPYNIFYFVIACISFYHPDANTIDDTHGPALVIVFNWLSALMLSGCIMNMFVYAGKFPQFREQFYQWFNKNKLFGISGLKP